VEQAQNIPTAGEPVPLAGQTLELTWSLTGVSDVVDLGVVTFTMRQHVGGANDVEKTATLSMPAVVVLATVTLASADTLDHPGVYAYELWDDTADVPLAAGRVVFGESVREDAVV
jgi:hypothetical protein